MNILSYVLNTTCLLRLAAPTGRSGHGAQAQDVRARAHGACLQEAEEAEAPHLRRGPQSTAACQRTDHMKLRGETERRNNSQSIYIKT